MRDHDHARVFRELHERDGLFIVPNPWDVGTARLLQHLGYEAVATTSAGFAFSIGRADSTVAGTDMLAHAADIVAAVDVPVTADLEDGYGADPNGVAEVIRRAATCGLAGASIEDATPARVDGLYDRARAVDRVRAAVDAANAVGSPPVITARCENYLVGNPDLGDTIDRLQAYQAAGADVLFAPGLATIEDVRSVVSSLDRPVNVIGGIPGADFTIDDLRAAGVRRVSLGSSLCRVALGSFVRAATDILTTGRFDYVDDLIGYDDVSGIFAEHWPAPVQGAVE